ncbi:hypothetical protein BC629DRAFT_471442 [Irpex lacteus]|nr:hypothetical protein BC629DRAFT_471442 [Irpex lacteus]
MQVPTVIAGKGIATELQYIYGLPHWLSLELHLRPDRYLFSQYPPAREGTWRVMFHTDSGLLWKLFRICGWNRDSNDASHSKHRFLRFSGSWHSEKKPSETDSTEGDAGISLPWEFKHKVHVGFDPVDGRLTGLPACWAAVLQKPAPMDRDSEAVLARCVPENGKPFLCGVILFF